MATPSRQRKDGTWPWRAHWREDNGRACNKTFETEQAAKDWEAKMRRERDDRALGRNTRARETHLREWIVEWWHREMTANPLATQENYSGAINRWINPEIGALKMIELRPERIAQLRDDLLDAGVGPSEVAYAQAVLSSCLGKAVERGLLDSNPCRDVAKPVVSKGKKQRWPVSPEEVELLRREFLTYRAPNSGAWTALRSATIVSVMAYAGLRPEEVMGLKRSAYRKAERVLVIEDVFAADHRQGDTKTHSDRIVSLQGAVVEDLTLWLDVLGAGEPGSWLFPPSREEPVTRNTHRNWTARPWKRARQAVMEQRPDLERTLGRATPRNLRAAFVSLLARAGWSDADIAEETGHSIEVLRKHYLGAIKMLRRLPTMPEADQINLARGKVGTPSVAQALRRELLGEAASPKVPLVMPNPATGGSV